MAKYLSSYLRTLLAVSLALLAPGFSSYAAAAQVVSARAYAGNVSVGAAGAAFHSGLTAPVPFSFSSLSVAPLLSPVLSGPVLTPSLALPVQVSQKALLAAPVPVVPVSALPAEVQALAQRSVLGSLTQTVSAEAPQPTALFDVRMDRLFDGVKARVGLAGVEPVETGRSVTTPSSGLSKAVRQDAIKTKAPDAAPRLGASKSQAFSRIGKVLLAAALLLALPSIALAAGPAAAVATSVSLVATIQPLATAVGAVAGAIYGMIAAHRKGEPAPSSGQILASMLRYGILGAAGIYVLLDVTQIFSVGFSAINPLSTALATAALGQSAFQGKFTDAATTPADRLIGAFPAIAAALGLSVGLLLSAPAALTVLAMSALSVTAVASSIYAALYKPGKSAAGGPTIMARGYVLQALMTGLALAVSGPYVTAAFMALAAWGFWGVLSTVLDEVWSNLPDSLRKFGRRKS